MTTAGLLRMLPKFEDWPITVPEGPVPGAAALAMVPNPWQLAPLSCRLGPVLMLPLA